MAEIQFERRGLPLWKVLLGLLVGGAAAFGGYELYERNAEPAPASAPARPSPPSGAVPSAAPTPARAP